MDRDSEDLFLGKRALDRKLITPAQLREAMIKQAGSAVPEGAEPPRLGDILVESKLLTADQLSGLQEETARIVRGPVAPRDATLGRILVERRTITQSQLLECLKSQSVSSVQVRTARAHGSRRINSRLGRRRAYWTHYSLCSAGRVRIWRFGFHAGWVCAGRARWL